MVILDVRLDTCWVYFGVAGWSEARYPEKAGRQGQDIRIFDVITEQASSWRIVA